MALAETAKLAIDLSLTGNAAAGLKGVEQRLTGLNAKVGRMSGGFKTLGAGIGVAFRNAAVIGIAALGGLSAIIVKSVREGQEAAKVQTIYANAIQNSGKVSTQYVGILNAQQTALMNLAGVDDELIKTEQTRLIQMGLTGDQVAKITPLILDFSKATGIDLLTATKLAGKAVNGNTGALARYGIQIDKAKAKTDPFAATVDALNGKFGGTTKALSGSLDARLGAFRENMANIREELGIKLLPALTRIVDVAGKDLVPAFGKFIDRIMPSLLEGVNKFADLLENGGAERGIKAITDALGPMVQLLGLAAAPVKAIVSAFLSLPSQVQGVLIGAFAVNKLSGGLIAKGVGEIAGGFLQRGGTPANPLFVLDVGGGLGGKIGGLAGGAAAGATLATGIIAALPIVAGAAVAYVTTHNTGIYDPRDLHRRQFSPAPPNDLLGRMGPYTSPDERPRTVTPTARRPGFSMEQARGNQAGVLARAVAAGFHPNASAIQRTMDKNARHEASLLQTVAANTRDTVIAVDRLNALGGILYQGGGRPAKDDATTKHGLALVQQSQNKRGFASGAWDVLGDETVDIHKGEMIVPRRMAEKFRRTAALNRLRDTSHSLSGLNRSWYNAAGLVQGVTGAQSSPFVPSAQLDASQIRDLRNVSMHPGRLPGRLLLVQHTQDQRERNVVAVVSTRDVKSSQIVKRRFGPTAAEAGAW